MKFQGLNSPPGKYNESIKVVDITFDVCDFFKKKRFPLIKYAYELAKQFGRIPDKCPVKKR